jgi:hypothetical protein
LRAKANNGQSARGKEGKQYHSRKPPEEGESDYGDKSVSGYGNQEGKNWNKHQPFAQTAVAKNYAWRTYRMRINWKTMRFLLFIILILLLIGALPTWPYSTGWGYYPSGGLGLILLIVLLVVLLR